MMLGTWKQWARRLKRDAYTLYFAYQDPRTPWYARLVAAGVVAYAFSPIDLIPDPIPVLGYLDDLILLPLGIALAMKLIPAPVLVDSRQKAHAAMERPTSRVAAAAIVAAWLVLAALALMLLLRLINR